MKEKKTEQKRFNIDNSKIKIAYILGCFPDNTPTFVINEIVDLNNLGLDITIFSIHQSNSDGYQPIIKKMLPNTIYVGSLFSNKIVLSHLYFLFTRPLVYSSLLFHYKKYGGKKAFWEGVYFSRKINQLGIGHVHAHFVWKAANVARLISSLTNIPFSFTAHAKDIYVRANHLKEKLEEAKFIVTCVKNNKNYLTMNFGQIYKKKIKVIYHGIDLKIFKPIKMKEKSIDVLSIGNFVEKKGFQYLIEACDILKNKGLLLKFLIIGEGHLKTQIINMIKELDLENYIELTERKPQSELPQFYAKSRIFVLPSFITKEGDRDGIPNVIAEAMAMGIPVISSNIPNISEVIKHEKDGILVNAKDPQAFADAIEKLLADEKLRKKLGENAREKIENKFDSKRHIRDLVSIFNNSPILN